jgi:hypothetical protein
MILATLYFEQQYPAEVVLKAEGGLKRKELENEGV